MRVYMKPSVYKLGRFLLWSAMDEKQAAAAWPVGTETVKAANRPSSFFSKVSSDYLLVVDSAADVSCEPRSLQRLFNIARDTGAGFIYSDFLVATANSLVPCPLNDYQPGSIRDNFNFGHFFILSVAAIRDAVKKYGLPRTDPDMALYDLRLKISLDSAIVHLPECLYAASQKKQVEKPTGKSEAHFDYVAKENFIRQKKLEKIATDHLKRTGAHLPARTKKANHEPASFQWEASIVIPVLNRKKIIADALASALGQKTNFAFNVIVVDNHSTDGTTNILKKFAAKYPNISHIIPRRRDLGIGGCWNEAISSPFCGRYAVQLDSDDLYSSPQALQKIVNTLRKGPYAMVVGSYTLVNEKLKPIPPWLIDHREWTPVNGHNNLLRVNGMGAPRAFDTDILRQIGFPNVSYGEDYAVALRLTREYKISRIFESLYLCRRWKDNTDSSLSVEKQNRNDYYKDKLRTMEIQARQLINCKERSRDLQVIETTHMGGKTVHYEKFLKNTIFAKFPAKENLTLPPLCLNLFDSQKKSWPRFSAACRDLAFVQERKLSCNHYKITLQYNPARVVSGGAAVDRESIKKRPCFLCADNRPAQQSGILYRNDYVILCNPAPIFDRHFTIVSLEHQPQEITSSLSWLLQLAADASPDYTVFYNGPACGASAPDHLHFQMIPADALPYLRESKHLTPVKPSVSIRYNFEKEIDRSAIVLASKNKKVLQMRFQRLLTIFKKKLGINDEPPINILCSYDEECWTLTVFLRRKHRPDAYFAEGEERIFISPGAIDMAGVIITPRLMDYERLDCSVLRDIYREVSLDQETLHEIMKAI